MSAIEMNINRNQNMQTNREMVSHPDHYNKGDSTYEPYKVIAKWGCNFAIGNAIKYLARYQNKWNPIEDLQKAKQYIDFEIERLKNENRTKPAEKPVDECQKRPILNGEGMMETGNPPNKSISDEKRKLLDRICRSDCRMKNKDDVVVDMPLDIFIDYIANKVFTPSEYAKIKDGVDKELDRALNHSKKKFTRSVI